MFLHRRSQTDTPPPPPHFGYASIHLKGELRQATALGSLPLVRDVTLNSELTDSSPEVSLLNTKRAAG